MKCEIFKNVIVFVLVFYRAVSDRVYALLAHTSQLITSAAVVLLSVFLITVTVQFSIAVSKK